MFVGDDLAKDCQLFESQNARMSTIMEKQLSVLSLSRMDNVLKYKTEKINCSDNSSDISKTINGGKYDEKIYTGVNSGIWPKINDTFEIRSCKRHKELTTDIKLIEV